jgi:FHA domain
VYQIQHYLNRLSEGIDQDSFVREFPHHVLVELEGSNKATPGGEVAVTEQLNQADLRRQSLSSRDSQVFPLPGLGEPGDPIRVGRAAPCEVIIDHGSVSKEHAHLIPTKDGLLVEDQGSTNGTYLNSKRIEAGTPTKIHPDDTVAFGRGTGFQLLDPPGFYRYLDLLRRFIGL